LARKFALVSSAVVLGGMIIIGSWVAMQVEGAVRHNVASSTAIYMDSFVTPLVQDLVKSDSLSEESVTALDALMDVAAVNMRVAAIKIWGPRGLLLYSTDKNRMGMQFKVKDQLKEAWQGVVTSSFQNVHQENKVEREAGAPLLEVYTPIHDGTGRVMAVAEFYQAAQSLRDEITASQRNSWMVTGVVALLMVATLFIVVSDGSHTIDNQAAALRRRVQELSQLLSLNETLRGRLHEMSNMAAAENERFLRKVGSDLHDGPTQMISLALLRLDALERPEDRETVRSALHEALTEIRGVATGLLMPAADGRSIGEALRHVADEHERRTNTKVAVEIHELPEDILEAHKVCLCRFAQEALTNAFRHAGGKGQSLRAWASRSAIFLQVADQGPGLPRSPRGDKRLGLAGLAHRIEAVGGTLKSGSTPGKGAKLTARLPLRTRG
jgi:signal transduction histidine kinase